MYSDDKSKNDVEIFSDTNSLSNETLKKKLEQKNRYKYKDLKI